MPGDDELTVDFSKVGDFFKRKKKAAPKDEPAPKIERPIEHESLLADKHGTAPHEPHHAHPPAAVEKNDSDISIDFSKIKKWFTKKETAHDAPKDELGFDFGKALGWVKKHPILVVLALLLILQFVPNLYHIGSQDFFMPWGGMHMRLRSQDLPAADGWAVNHVHGILKGQFTNAINQQYPNLPDDRKSKLVEEEWQKLVAQNGDQINLQVQAVAQQIRAFWQYETDGLTYTYMPDIDPYTYLRYARNIIEKGHVEDEVKNGMLLDNHMNAPMGGDITPELQPYVLAWMHRVMSVFNPKITLMQSATYFPIIFMLLTLIPAFFIGRRFAGMPGGIITATMIAIMPAIITRTTWGHADTDVWNILFPLLLTWLYFLMIDAQDKKHMIGYAAVAGLVTGIYAFAWRGGWWYVFDFLLAAFGILVLSEIIQNIKQPRKLKDIILNRATIGITFLLSSAVFVSWFMTAWDFFVAPLQPLRFTVIKAAAHPSLWPNVYTTVAELNPTDIAGVVNAVGGWLFFWIGLAGIALLLFQRKDNEWKLDLKYAPLLALWFIATTYASTKGVRFTLLLAPAFAVAFGIALGKIYEWVIQVSTKDLHLNAKLAHGVMIVIILFMLGGPARVSHGAGGGDIPIMNDAWWNALNAIKDDSQPNAIINSWWDFGHHFKYVADRPVTFDGASQNTPMAHWIGRVLSTNNETEAIGILRMLDCGSNYAFDTINQQLQDPVKSVNILYRMIGVDRKAALAILAREGVNEQDKVLQYTHCSPPENYFIASDDMIGKSGVWGHFGMWNFERAKTWIVLRNQDQETAVATMMKDWNYTREEAEQAYFSVQGLANENDANAWISPWPGILGGPADCNTQAGTVITCMNGVQHNLSNGETTVTVQGGTGRPPLFVMPREDGTYKETRYNGSTVNIAALVYPTGPGTYRSILASPELINSIFVRMYFLEGHGLKYFKEFNRQSQLTGGQIITYKVAWNGTQPHIFSGFAAAKAAPAAETSTTPATGAQEGDTVGVYYIGSLMNGTVFDSSIKDWKKKSITIDNTFDGAELNPPLSFALGGGKVIIGFDVAIRGMSVGDEQVVQIPPNAAYGFDPKAHFLGNQTLRFKIKLISLEKKQ